MTLLFLILIILASVILGFIILVQSPKGGGLAGNVGGLSNQFMGVKQTTDLLEKGTWVFATIVALLCLFSSVFIPSTSGRNPNSIMDQMNTKPAVTAPAQSPAPGTQPLLPNTAPPATDSQPK